MSIAQNENKHKTHWFARVWQKKKREMSFQFVINTLQLAHTHAHPQTISGGGGGGGEEKKWIIYCYFN